VGSLRVPSRDSASYGDDLGVYGLPGDVAPWQAFFDPARDLAALDTARLRIKVRAEAALSEAMLVVRDGSTVTGYPMKDVTPGDPIRTWLVDIDAYPATVHYSFAFRSPAGRPVYLVPAGVSNAVERLDRWELAPGEPPVVTVPEWAKGAFIYQIFPDRFANGDRSTDPPDVEPWHSPPHSRGFKGGDLTGVRSRLGYLSDLGVEMIYLNPIFSSPSNHRYDAADYYTVDPMLGGNAALQSLVLDAHAKGMKVIVDASFNHVHPRFFAFADLIERGERSEYRDWFVVNEWPLRIRYRPSKKGGWIEDWIPVWKKEIGIPVEEAKDPGPPVEPTYDSWYGVPSMPRLNLANPGTRRYALDVARHWVSEFGIDGWRMDVARYVDHDFWADFRKAVKAVNPDAYLLSEIMGDASAWMGEAGFDATMNYTFRDLAVSFLAKEEKDGSETIRDLARMMVMYPWAVTLANQNLIGSHDTPRFLTVAGGALWRLRLATVLQFTIPGAPGVYYGDEVGLSGGHDPGSRAGFPWEPDPTRHEIHRTITDLVALRRSQPALVAGDWSPLASGRHFFAFERRLGRRRAVVAINRGARAVHVSGGHSVKHRWGNGTVTDGDLRVAGRSAVVAW